MSNIVLATNGTQSQFTAPEAHIAIPLSIPKGARISARCQCSTGSQTARVHLQLFDGAHTMMEGAAGVDAIGFSSSTSLGTPLVPNASANTKGSYAQLVASTLRDYMGFFGIVDGQLVAPSGNINNAYDVDVAIGGSGSEVVILPDFLAWSSLANTSIQASGALIPFVPLLIPKSTRVAARCACTTASASNCGLTLYGVYQ